MILQIMEPRITGTSMWEFIKKNYFDFDDFSN